MSLLARLSLIAVAALLPTRAPAQQPPTAVARDTAAAAADTLKAVEEPLVLAGFYELSGGRGITVSLEDDNLYGTPSNAEKRKLVHKYGTTYAVEGTQMTVTFTLDANGLPTEMVMRQNGQQRILRKGR